jgi:hypothetical protein
MEIKELSNEELENQIETFQDRIETLLDYISDEDDGATRSAMQMQLPRYRMTLQLLKEERNLRVTQKTNTTKIDLNDFLFKSSDHLRYENKLHVSGPHGIANRAIKIENNITGGSGFTVTLYNLDGNHPVWQNNIQMSPKQMKIIEANENKISLKGFGQDQMGASFEDYGFTIILKNEEVEKCILHMYDRNVDIEYIK